MTSIRRHASVVTAVIVLGTSMLVIGEWALSSAAASISALDLVRFGAVPCLLIAAGFLLYREFESNLRQRTRALEQAKAKDEALLSSIGDGVFATDIQGKIIFINQVALHKLKWKSTDQILGLRATDAIRMEDESGVEIAPSIRPLTQVLRGKPGQNTPLSAVGKYYYVRADKTRFPAAITVSPVLVEGEAVGAIEVFRDITKEKEVDQAKTDFVSLASHQLRTPLSTINWYSEMLLAGDAGKISREQRKYIEEIYRGNQRMVALVSDLLSVSRIEVGTFTVDPEPTNILELAKQIISDLEPRIFKRKIGLAEHYDDDIPLMNIDPKLTGIVIDNLLSNAIKYTPEAGHIDFTIRKQENAVHISVKDNGYGIPAQQQDKIFGKLFRADNIRDKETDGTGLGLYITKAIVDYSGGKIWFESVENKGSVFNVSLPLVGMSKKTGSRSIERPHHSQADERNAP